jgi:alpha-mannosidase
MANEENKTIPSVEGMEAHIDTWRGLIKNKQRGIFAFDELCEIKLKTLKKRIYTDFELTPAWKMRECIYKDIGDYEYLYDGWKELNVGEYWGGNGMSAFFKNKIVIPEKFDGKKVTLYVYFGGDSLVSVNGVPYQGLDPFRNAVVLTNSAKAGEVFDIDIESYFVWHSNESSLKKLECSFIATTDDEINEIYWDIKAVFNALFIPGMGNDYATLIREALKEAFCYVDFDEPDFNVFKAKLRMCKKILYDKVYNNPNYKCMGKLDLIGNSHLDMVYMWAYKEFVRKVGRTHATMLRLMEQYPDFIFSQSQAGMYEEMRIHYPNLFEQVQQRVKEGRWEYIGGMWVEPDCNIISGESFVRQFLHGVRYAEKWFGVTPKTCWLPDVFGNSYCMPQIMKKAGMEYFVTHKMGIWNDTNPWLYNSFWWEGPDGSKVFAAVPPTHFIGTMEPDTLKTNWIKYSDKDTIGESMYCYGWGDGGGGVDNEMLEYVKRYKNFPGLPETKACKIEESLESMKQKAIKAGDKIVTWKDELYLEEHRGVHTTKAALKKSNRYCENLLREAEMYASIAEMYGYTYPTEELSLAWRKVLTNQFHDSLPGTHVTEVFAKLMSIYAEVIKTGENVRDTALEVIAKHIGFDAKVGKPFALFNSLGVAATNKVELDYSDVAILDENGDNVPVQVYEKLNGEKKLIFVAKDIPAVGYKVYYKVPAKSAPKSVESKGKEIENGRFKLKFNDNATLVSIFDKVNNREVLSKGGLGNNFRLFEDMPGGYDAWDIVATYVDREYELKDGVVKDIVSGDVCTVISIEKEVLKSVIHQNIIIYNELDRIDFDTHISWHEDQKLLKVFFDVDLQTKNYTRDIAYATMECCSYRYNPYDKAKFEVNAHNWIDMSDEDYGVSLLNDCKYGHEVKEHTMILTLLKAPIKPDPQSDRGDHYFVYSVYPHADTWKRAKTLTRGLEINHPVVPVELKENGEKATDGSFITLTADNMTLEAVKKCEDEDAYIIRMVEKTGRNVDAEVSFFAPLTYAAECDLIERNDVPIEYSGNTIKFHASPFEIKNFKVKI